ncbi:ankyrin-2-like isoform X8 [Limulus polyphemus]|uniref:Ankyrin-2-like isoform X8 n=1 Tax=Limulus polyphemus TaxID=6850 RepID=A0ABM1SU40_LIMPO|nr:ankyrin-2-like isoform X8 [Limulus polyphemus]
MLKMLMKRFPSVGNAIYQLQTDGNASFLRAARAGNLEKVLEYLKGSIDINTSNANGLNALHLASKEGHVNIVSELLKRGANVNAATKKGNTALHIASLAGQEAVVKILVQSGANVNVQSQNGFTPLYMAAQENHDNVVRFLLANGANQSLATEDGFTPLAVALQQGHDKVVAVLLENDAKGRVRLPALHIAAKKDDCKAAALLLQNDHNPDVTSKSGFTPLHIAAHYGNDNIGRLLLEKGAEINYAAKHQITPLHVASKWGKANMATLLLDKGAKIDAFTRDGLTPLHCAARSGHDHVVDLLLEKGAPITAKTKNGLAPLHMASQGDHVDGARILLYHKAPVDDVTVDYLTALHVAAHCGHVRVAKLLLDRKADPNARALNGFTPLHIACKKNRIKVVELLLKHGASIEARTESGLTPLHVAAFMGNMNIVIFLIQHGADPDIPTVRGETPIHLAARANQADIIRILLRNGARVDAKAREHQTPLHIAARLGNVDIVSLLIQHGAAVDATTKDMYTALHIAAKEGQEEVASVLLDNGASLTATTKKGFTPLHLAAKYGNIKVARLLLQKDAPVDAQGKNGVTPLHVAAHYDHVNVALLLLDKGASPHATAKNGYTPLHIAAKKSQMDIATTLLEYGAKANSESKAGFTPLHLAAQEGHTDMTTLLIEHRADVNMKAKNGLTPLHLCGQEDHVNVAAILVKNDAEIDPETNAGYTPLHVACHFGQVNMVRFLLQHASNVNSITSHGYTPLHQAAQQGHTLIISLLLENKASPNALTNQGQTALSIAKRLGYISVVETLKVVTETTTITTTTTIVEEKYKVVAPETMQETFMSDSEDEGGDEIEDTALFGKPTHATHVYLPYYEGQKLQTREDTILGDQSMRYLTADEMKSLGDDSLPIDVTKDERTAESMLLSADSGAPLTVEEDHLSPLHVRHDIETVFVSNYAADNVDISRAPVHAGKLKWKTFLVSFMVDARGGAMRGCRHSGVRVIIPPRKAPMPMRITCRYLRKEKLTHPPPLMEGEACASRILEIGPVGAKFLGPVIIEVPHFASLRRKEREITILRSDNGEAWREHTLEATEEAVQDVLNESFEGEELNALQDLNTNRITQILTTDFPQYFAIITRVRQEVHAIGPEGGMVSSTVVPQVQAIFPEGALTKKIKVGLQAQPIPPELVSKLLGNRVGVSPIVTVEPRRRKFHKPITLTIPVPQAATKGMINQYSGDAPTLRLLCSITGSRMSGGVTKAQWEDVTGSTPLTFVNDCVSFTTTVSARFWLMDCRQVNEVTKYATELYREAVHVPFMAKFVVFAKHYEPMEAQLRVFCMTDDKEEKTLESQENFSEVAKSRDVEVLEGKSQFLEFAGNLVPVTKSGEQLALNFQAFRENRLPFIVRVKDPHQESVGRIAFMREPKVSRGEPPQTPICNLNIVLPDICKIEVKPVPTELVTLEKKYGFVEETGLAKPELIHRADLRLSDIARGLDQDWVQLADQLDVSESEVNNIKKEQPNDPVQQALVMLRLWLQQANEDATGNNLEKALRKIGREDIVNSCMFNVEIVTDDVEKAVAKVHLDQSGFDAFKDELGSSRDASLRRDISLDVSYDEQDIMKEAESAEETSSEAGSVHEKQPSTPVEKKPEEEPNEEKIMEPTIAEELFDHKSPPLEPKITTRDVDILPESLTAKHTEEIDDRQTTTTKTETEKLLVDDTTKHSITTVTKTTVVHDLGELPPELRDQMIKQAKSEEWSSSEMGSSHVSFSGLPEDEQSELVTISTTLESEVAERKTEVDSHIDEKAWTETDESGAVQHIIQKEKQSTFTVKDGQSESHPGTEGDDTTVSSSVVSEISQELKHEEKRLSFAEKRDFFQKLSETYDSPAKKIDPSLYFSSHDGIDSDIQKPEDYDIQKIQMDIEQYPQKSEIIEEHKSFQERLHFFKTSIGESEQSGFTKENIPTETSTKGMPGDIPEKERKLETDFRETVIKDTAGPESEFSECFTEEYQVINDMGNEMLEKEKIISEFAPKEQRREKKLHEVEENIQEELIRKHNGFALEIDKGISDKISHLSESAKQDVIVKEKLQEEFEEKSVQEISQTSLDENFLVKPKQSITEQEQPLIDWELKELEIQKDMTDKKILSDISTAIAENKYLISSQSKEELKLLKVEECKLKLEDSKTMKEEKSLDIRKTEQTVFEQECFLSESNLENQEVQKEEEMQNTEPKQKSEDISIEKELPISVSSTTEQIQKDLIHCLEEPRSILAEDQLSKKLDTTKLEYTKGAPSLSSESSTESFIQGEQQFSTQKYETINMKKEIEQSQKNVSFSSEEEEREMLEKELEQTSLKDVEQQATSMLSEVSKESLVVEIGTTCDSEKTSEEDELWKEVEDSNESVKKEADSFETDSQSPTEKERLDKPMISDFSKKDESLMKSDTSLNVKSTDLSRSPEQFVQKDETDSKTYREIKRELDKKESVSEIDDKQSVFSTQESPSISLTSQAFALDSTVHQPQVASDTGREPSHIEPTSPPTEHKLSSHEDKQSPLSRPSPPETTSYSTEQEISPAADYTVYLVPEMQVHVGVSPTESKPAASESGKDEEKQVKKLEEDFDSKLVSEPLSETEKKPLTNMHSSSPQKTYSEIQRTEYAYGSKGSESSDGIEDVSSKVYQVHTWTESTHLSEISQGSEIDVALHETPVGYENTAFAGVDVIDEPAMQEPDSGRATSPYEVLRPSTPTLPIGQDKTVKMDQEIFSQFSKQNMDTSEKDSKTHVEHHIKSQIFNEELDLSIEENTPEKKDILEEKSMIQTEVDRDIIVVQQIRSEIFAHELAEDIENDLPEGKDIPYDQGNAKSKGIIETKAYEEKGEIIDQVISRYDINIAKTDDKQVYENEFSQEKNSIIEKSEWEQKSKIVAVEHVMWETSVQQDSEEIIEEEVKELPREKQIIVEHEENESLEGSVDDSEKIESCDKQKDISSEESRDDEILYSLREEATKVAQDIIEDIKTEVSRCHTLEHSLSEISDEDLVEKSEEYMLSHQEVEYLLKTRDKPEEKRVSFSEDMPEIPQITTEEFETIECDQMHTEEEEHKSKLEHYEHLDDQEKGDTCATFKEVVLSSEQKVYQKETVKGEDSYNESKPSSGIICDKQKKKYITEAQKFPNEVQKTLTQATGDRTDNFSQCLSSFEKIQLDDKLVTFTTAGKETKEESANIMTSEIKLFENVTEEVKEKESDLLSTHAEDDEKMLKESIVEKVQKQDYMSSTPIVLDQKQEEKASSKKQLDLSSFSSYTHVEKCISDDFAKTEKDKEIFDMHLTSGEKIQIVEKKLENIQQPGNETVDVSKKTSVKKSESSENITYRDIQSFTQQKETVILDSSEELIQSLYECDQLMKDEKKTASVQKSTINYQSEDSSFESVDLQEKIIMRDQTISEATIKSDVEKKNESDKLDKFISGRTTDLSELSNLTRKEKQISREGETCSSSGETDSHYYSFEMSDSGRTPRETPATSRPCSSEFDINISAPISSEYETCATSQEVSGDISGSYSTAYTSQEISFATAHSSLSHSSRESAISVDSESSGHLASVEVSSEASETLVPSAQEMEQEFGRDIETPTPDDNEMAQAFVVREPYDSEIPEEVIRGGVEVPFLSDWKTKESFEASYPQSSGAIFSQWSNLIEVHEIPSSPFEIITEEDLADYPGDYLEHISESECLDSHKAEESKLKDKHKLEKNSKEIKSDDIIHEHTATDVVVVSETVQSTVGIEGQRSISDEQTPILDGQLFSDEHTLRSFIYRQESGAYLAAESVDDLTDQMSCSQEELSASESSVTHSEQTWLSSSVETTILATEQQTWPCSGAVSQDQQVTETMHIFAEQQFSTHESSDVVSEQPPERSPYPSDLMLYPQVNGPVEVDYVPEYDAPYPESQEQETEVESTFAEGTPTMFAVTGDSNSNDTQDTSEQTSMVEATRNILLSATGISALVPSQVHQPESERVYDESQELQPPTVSLGHTVSEQCSESDSSEGDIQDIQTIQEIQELQEQEYAQEYETCRAEADEVYFQYYQRQYEENEEETQNLPCEVDKTVDWPESELLEEFYESGKIAEVSEDQVDSEIKSVLSHAVESEQEKDLEDIERPMSPEPPDYSSLGENDSYLPESDQGSVFLQQNIPSAQETSLRHTSVTSTTQFPATKIMSESTSADQQLVTHTEGFSRQFQTDSHISESFEIMDKKEVADTKPEEDTYDIITENEIQTVSSIEKSSSSKIQQGDIMEESLLSKAQRSCGQQSLAESHIATAVSEKFTIQAHQAYKHDIEQDSNFQSKNVMEEDKDGRPSGQKVTYTYGIQFERKQEHDLEEDSFGELYTHREEDEDGFEEIERASKTKPSSCEKIHSSDLNAFAGKKYISKSEQEDGSVSSLQEFENLESGVTIGEKSSLGLVDLVIGKTVLSKSGEVDDISLCSQTEFEQLEKECEEVEHAATKEDFSKSSEIKESYHVQDITEDAESSESDDYEKRMSEIDEIIRQAQTNVEQFHADHDQSLSESAGFTIKLQKYTGTLSSESTESSLMEKTSSQKDDHDIDSLNGNGVLERQVSVEGHMLETNEQSIVHELETRPALPQHIIIGRTVSGHSAESCDSQPRSSTSTVTQYDIESLREREAELEETEAVGDLKSRLFIDQRVEKYGTLEEDKDFMHEEFDHSFHEDSIYEKKEIHAEESSLLSDKSADVDSLLEEKADKDSLQEERDVDQDSLHEEMDLPDDQEAILPGAQKASEQVIIKSSWHQRHLSEDECDKDSLKDEHITGQDTSSSGKDGQGSGGKGDCMISSTDSLEPSSSTATHATYQFETDSVMSSSVNSVHTSGEESTMVSSTDTIEPEVVLSYSVGDMSEATESHKIFSRDQVESHLQLKSEIRSLVKDADKNYKTVISQSMTQPSQLIICLSEESTKPRMSHDVEQVLGKDAETFSAGKSSEVYEEVEAKDESENQVVIHSVEKDIVWQEKLDSTESETDIEEKVKDVIEKQVTGVNDGDETQKDHPTDEKGNLVITKMIKQHLTSEPQVMTYLDEETPESGVASYVKKSFEADKNIAVIQKPSESVEEIETIDASGNQVIICHIKNNITCEANRDITDSERVVEKHLKDFIPKQTIDIDYGDDEVEGHPSVDEKGTVVITKTIKELLNSEPQGPEETLTCQLVTHLDDKTFESGSTSDAVETFKAEKDASIAFKDEPSEMLEEIKTTGVKRNILYEPTISSTDKIEEKLKDLLKEQTLGVGKDHEEVEEHQKVDEKGNVIITRTVKRHVTSEPQIHKKTFMGPDAEKQTKEFFQSFDSLKPTEDEDHYEGVDDEGNMIRVTQKFVVKPEIHTVTFTGPDAHKQMEYFMKTWSESQDGERDSNDAHCHRLNVYTNDSSGEKISSSQAEPQDTQSPPVSSVYFCASSLSKMLDSDDHEHSSSYQTDEGLESDPVFHLKTQEPTSTAGQMLDRGTQQFHFRDVSDGVPLPAASTRHTVYRQDDRTVHFDPREYDHEFHSKFPSHFTCAEEEKEEFGSGHWQQDSGDGHWTGQSTTEARSETTCTSTTVGADGQRCTVTETTTQYGDIEKHGSLQQSMQEILNQFMTDEGSSQTAYHFDDDKE